MPSALELEPLETPRSLSVDAAAVIRRRILDGGFQRGEHLVEARLAEQLRISRGSVREAFKLLRAEGLVEEEPRRGTFVISLNGRDVREIYEIRGAIEGVAAESVARAHDPAAIDELQGALDAMARANKRHDLAAVGRSDLAFHEAICRLSGNSRLHSVFLQHAPALRTLLKIDEHLYAGTEIVDQHATILAAIKAGDVDRAGALSRAHCHEAQEKIAAYLDNLPDA